MGLAAGRPHVLLGRIDRSLSSDGHPPLLIFMTVSLGSGSAHVRGRCTVARFFNGQRDKDDGVMRAEDVKKKHLTGEAVVENTQILLHRLLNAAVTARSRRDLRSRNQF